MNLENYYWYFNEGLSKNLCNDIIQYALSKQKEEGIVDGVKRSQDSLDISKKIDALNDSITTLDIKILDMESKSTDSNEMGAIQYVSEITGASLQTVANWFIFLLIFVFANAFLPINAMADSSEFSSPKEENNKFCNKKDKKIPNSLI